MGDVQRWIHKHSGEVQSIDLVWDITPEPDEGAYHRLLEILFSPQPGDQAAEEVEGDSRST